MLYIMIAAAVCVFDQLVKLWTVSNIDLHESMEFIPGILRLRHERNTGAALSIFEEHTWLLAVISVLVAILLLVLILRKGFSKWEKISLALVLGGAVGNAIDRIMLSYVVDMLEMEFLPVFVFNIADVFIDVGAVIFVILYIVRTVKEEKGKHGVMPELERLKNSSCDTGHANISPEDEDAGKND